MNCAWQELLAILPQNMRKEVDQIGKESLQELRLKIGHAPELRLQENTVFLSHSITERELEYVINMASQYSPWSASSISEAYITAPGGHRIGICGETAMAGDKVILRNPKSLCVRVARYFPDISGELANRQDSILIMGVPGSGKTTLLRDLIQKRSSIQKEHIAVADERKELFPFTESGYILQPSVFVDVMSGCKKSWGLTSLLRVMSPDTIAVDEITCQDDAEAIISIGNCGVKLIATAHGESMTDLKDRQIYHQLYEHRIFSYLVCLRKDHTWEGATITYDN